jgi:hypothetical protein
MYIDITIYWALSRRNFNMWWEVRSLEHGSPGDLLIPAAVKSTGFPVFPSIRVSAGIH